MNGLDWFYGRYPNTLPSDDPTISWYSPDKSMRYFHPKSGIQYNYPQFPGATVQPNEQGSYFFYTKFFDNEWFGDYHLQSKVTIFSDTGFTNNIFVSFCCIFSYRVDLTNQQRSEGKQMKGGGRCGSLHVLALASDFAFPSLP